MNRAALGAEGVPFELHVERGKIAEFARAIGATDPAHFQGERPIAPPTFLTTMAFWEAGVPGSNPWALLELDVGRARHAEQTFEYFGPPPRAGDRLQCRSRIESITEKPGKRGALMFAVMVTDFHDAVTGRLVAQARLTGVEVP